MGLWAIFKENKPWGYYDRLAERESEPNAVAGTNTLTGTAVPAGEVWVVLAANAVNVNTANTQTRLQATDGTSTLTLEEDNSPAAGQQTMWTGEVVLKEGDTFRARFTGCNLNDDLYLDYWGYKMKV